MFFGGDYDVIVVGAGHAGAEAALAAARMGRKTLVLALNLDAVALMACNPAIGGTAKGHIVREIDALGGEMAKAADYSVLQMKTLNSGKGPAVRCLRAQTDKKAYGAYMKRALENTENLFLRQDEAARITTRGGRVSGVITAMGTQYGARAVILCTGVYLKGKIIVGAYQKSSGPSGLHPADILSDALLELGFTLKRFKTGTPARVDGRTIDYSKTEAQYGDEFPEAFSYSTKTLNSPQAPCFLTYTTQKTHDIIRQNLHLSPLFSGEIKGVGPRYCPSIEDKIVKFPDKERHQMFLEPEGANTNEVYVQGMSSSLPAHVQEQIYRSVPGMKNAHLMRPAYAIEYDCIDSTQLNTALMRKDIPGLFCAGQINGTSGYEEAACQGLLAGANAALYIAGEPPLTIGRHQAYSGVLIDDLVTKGTDEPYRMMTSRAEHRLLLRQDNADARLTQAAYAIGLVPEAAYGAYMRRQEQIAAAKRHMREERADAVTAKSLLEAAGQPESGGAVKIAALIKRGVPFEAIEQNGLLPQDIGRAEAASAAYDIRYEGYIAKQEAQVKRAQSLENARLPQDADYSSISGLRLEARAKLSKIRPQTVGQASRISGVSPADISVLLVWLQAQKQPADA